MSPSVCGHIDARLGGSRADAQSETKFPQLLSPLIRGVIDFLTASKEPGYGVSDETRPLLATISGVRPAACTLYGSLRHSLPALVALPTEAMPAYTPPKSPYSGLQRHIKFAVSGAHAA
ncbi:MAG: hypothetical protein LBD58_09640 [Treponema sp.]|nr:hypothetical protein [Treponema sp.]